MISAAAVSDFKTRGDWMAATPSYLIDHGACCAAAKSWLIAMSRSIDFASTDGFALSAPRWLTYRYDWGPTRWPISWCEAIKAETIDCGVFAAFAREIFTAKGLVVHRGQVLRAHDRASTSHWRAKWAALPGAFDWISDDLVYHEIVMVEPPRQDPQATVPEIAIYDSTDGLWLDPAIVRGHGSHLAVRGDVTAARRWGDHIVTPKQWLELRND